MDISITDAAHAMGVSRKALSKIVNGKGRVTPEIAVRFPLRWARAPRCGLAIRAPSTSGEIEQHRSELDVSPLVRLA